jgi:hypothetical protein
MRRLALVLLALLVASGGAAAPGDRLEVLAADTDVRAAPTADAEVLMQVQRGEPAIERRRWDVWVAVELPRLDRGGWIHTSRLGRASGALQRAEKIAPAAAAAEESEALRRFRGGLGRANRHYRTADGPLPFVGARSAGPDTVQVVVRRAWMARPLAVRERELAQLFERWLAAAGEGGALRLEIIEPDGHVLMSTTGPGAPALSLADGEG